MCRGPGAPSWRDYKINAFPCLTCLSWFFCVHPAVLTFFKRDQKPNIALRAYQIYNMIETGVGGQHLLRVKGQSLFSAAQYRAWGRDILIAAGALRGWRRGCSGNRARFR